MGAWIEISLFAMLDYLTYVAPYMGAWIEIQFGRYYGAVTIVAPYMGAWIEINLETVKVPLRKLSHPTWVRGLKSPINTGSSKNGKVAPYMGAWIEIPVP